MPWRRVYDLTALALFAAMAAGVAWGMFAARRWAETSYGTPAAQAEWDEWRDAAAEQAAGEGPVRRRVPASEAPPALVLLTDHFAVVTAFALTMCSLLYAVGAFLLRGALRGGGPAPPARPGA